MHANLRQSDATQVTLRTPAQTVLTSVSDRLLGQRGCLFTFHRAADASVWSGLPNRDFYLNLDFLDRLLTYLVLHGWDIVTIEEATGRIKSGRISRKFVNFSVDDCYRDTYEQVVPLFRHHGVPVTLFVTTGIPDGTLPLIFAGLEDVLFDRKRVQLETGWQETPTPEARRDLFAQLAREWDGPDGAARYARFCDLNDVDRDAMHWKHAISWEMLAELTSDPHVEIGAHTVTHARISSLTPDAATAEIAGSRLRLEEKLGIPVRHFAFPYGRSADCGSRDFQIALDAGFTSTSTTRKGLVTTRSEIDHLPRVTLNGSHQTLMMVEAHLTGLTATLARILNRV